MLLYLVMAVASGAAPALQVSGTAMRITETHPCLGGARVTEEMIAREETPLAKQDLTVFAGSAPTGKVVARATTDSDGRFTTRLAPGAYCVVMGRRESAAVPKRAPKPAPDAGPERPVAPVDPNYDADCMAQLENPVPTCDQQIAVPESGPVAVRVRLYSSNRCHQPYAHPCWRGPMPP